MWENAFVEIAIFLDIIPAVFHAAPIGVRSVSEQIMRVKK